METGEKKFEVEMPLSRRQFLERILKLGISLGTTSLLGTNILSYAEGGRLPFPKERFLVTSPKGKEKVGMVLGTHEIAGGEEENAFVHRPRVTLLEEGELWFPVGALFLDSCDDYLNPQIRKLLSSLFLTANEKPPFFLKKLLIYANKENIPIILGDLTLRSYSVDEVARKDLSLILNCFSAILSNVGLVLKESDSKISRRKFLKGVVFGGTLGVAHFSAPGIVGVCRKLGIRLDSEIGRDFQAMISDIFHPENWLVVMRNIVWALKIRDFYKRGEISSDKIINVIGGSDHRFFDFFFRYPEIAIKYWKLFNYKTIATEFAGGNPDWVYKSWIFYPKKQREKIITHEDLKELVEKV